MIIRSINIPSFIFCTLITSIAVAQKPAANPNKNVVTAQDTLYENTQPLRGFRIFVRQLEIALAKEDTVGRKHRMRVNNIGFFVSKTGTIDSTWVIFRPRPIHNEIMKFMRTTRWQPAQHNGQPLTSQQDIDIEIYLTKAALKRHRQWRSLPERIFSPFSN